MENKIIENILTRRSVRSFLNDEVEQDKIDLILKAGSYAPSGMGKQSPVIICIKDKTYRDKISALNAKVLNSSNDPYYGATIIILVLADKNIHTNIEDGSCALENMMLAAHSLGLSTCWIHRAREMFDSQEGKDLLKEWGISEELIGIGSLALGYAKNNNQVAKPRKDNYIKII